MLDNAPRRPPVSQREEALRLRAQMADGVVRVPILVRDLVKALRPAE